MSVAKQNYDIPIHDIKPLIEVQEYSMYYTIALTLFVVFISLAILYFIYKWFSSRNRYNIRKEHYELLNEIDIDDTKNTAYKLSAYGYTFKNDSPRHHEMYQNLLERLEEYKYKKEVDAFDEEVKGYIELYKGMIDV